MLRIQYFKASAPIQFSIFRGVTMEIEKPTVLDASEPVSRAITEISKTGLPVIVTKNGKYIGIIDERALRLHTDPAKEKCGNVTERAPMLTSESTVLEACNAFFSGRFKAIPVMKKGKIEGAVTRHTLLNELLKEKMLSRKSVSEVMTSPVASIDLSSTLGQARAELRKNNIRRLVVTKDGKISGLLSVFDLASFTSNPRESDAFYRGGEKTSMDAQPIASYIKKEVETVGAGDSLAVAVKKMLERRVAALIVVENSYPKGIVTAKDILQSALAEEKTARVFVSGLPYEDREFNAEIVREGEKLLSRFAKSFEVQALAVHVKKEGSGFAVRARLDADQSFNASAFDFRLEVAVATVMSELGKMAGKKKVIKMDRKKTGRRSDEETIL